MTKILAALIASSLFAVGAFAQDAASAPAPKKAKTSHKASHKASSKKVEAPAAAASK